MTESEVVPDGIEQVLLEVSGPRPVVLAGSFEVGPEPAWVDELEPHLRAAAGGLVYLRTSGGRAAALTGHEPGPGLRVLLGPATELTPQLALGLADRPGWDGWAQGVPPPRVSAADLWPDDQERSRLRGRALAQDELLARVLAWSLQGPTRPLAIVGCPPDGRIGLLWGLLEIAAPLLTARSWSFSTADADPAAVDDDVLPEIVFLAARPVEPPRVRMVVDPTAQQGASPANEHQANSLVFRYEFGRDPVPVQPQPSVQQPPVRYAPAPPALAPAPPPPPPSPRRSAVDRAAIADEVARLAAARDDFGLATALRALQQEAVEPDERAVLRAELDLVDWATAAIERSLGPDDRAPAREWLVKIALGERVPDLDDAERLVLGTGSIPLARAVGRVAEESGRLVAVAPALARRWLFDPDAVAPEPPPLTVLARALEVVGVEMPPGLEWRIRTGLLIVLALGLGLMIGLVL